MKVLLESIESHREDGAIECLAVLVEKQRVEWSQSTPLTPDIQDLISTSIEFLGRPNLEFRELCFINNENGSYFRMTFEDSKVEEHHSFFDCSQKIIHPLKKVFQSEEASENWTASLQQLKRT